MDDLTLPLAAAAVGALVLRDKDGQSLAQNIVDSAAYGLGSSVGSAPSQFVGGVAAGFTGSAKETGWGLADAWISIEPEWLLSIQRSFFQALPALY